MPNHFKKFESFTYPEQEMLEKSKSFFSLMDHRRSIREFSDQPVAKEVIENIIKTASTAPSGAHKQPWTFCVDSNPEIKKQIRIAETEKYPHVTFFFSGGREAVFEGETRLLSPSPKDVATYDLKPEMSAKDLAANLVPELQKEEVDFVCLNFANPDMVGHTGVFEAVVQAVETVDACLKEVVETGKAHGYTSIVIADHGNEDYMLNDDKSVNTAHSLNLVPFIVVDDAYKGTPKHGKLGDVAPTVLHIMGIDIPSEMTGNILV